MRPSQLADLLDVSGMTLRRWAKDYAPFLSPGANPPKGQTRVFDTHDQRVLLYVATMRDQGLDQEAITQRLSEMQANEWDGLPTVPPEWQDTGKSVPVELAAARASEMATAAALQTELQHTRQALQEAQERVLALEESLATAEAAQSATEHEKHDLELRLSEARGEVATLAARLEAYSMSYGFGRDKPVNVGVLLVVALLAGALLVTLAFVVARLVI